MYGYIYITTNLINGRKYIGKHTAKQFDTKYFGSGADLTTDINKLGLENFECHILESINGINTICEDIYELCEAEKYYIDYYNCVESEDYYNLVPGGNWSISLGGTFKRSADFKERVSISSTGKAAMRKGNIKTWVMHNKIDEYLLDGWEFGWKEKSNKIIKPKEKRRGICKDGVYKTVPISALDGYLADGWILGDNTRKYIPWCTGKKLSEEMRHTLSISHLNHHNTKEAVEKQAKKLRGRIAVTKDGIKKLIYSEDLATYLDSGWSREIKHTDKRSRQVVCYETQHIYESITAATKDTGCNVRRVLNSDASSTSKGYHWYFNDDEERKLQINKFKD